MIRGVKHQNPGEKKGAVDTALVEDIYEFGRSHSFKYDIEISECGGRVLQRLYEHKNNEFVCQKRPNNMITNRIDIFYMM